MPTFTERVIAVDLSALLPPERPIRLRPHHDADYALAHAFALSARSAAERGDVPRDRVRGSLADHARVQIAAAHPRLRGKSDEPGLGVLQLAVERPGVDI